MPYQKCLILFVFVFCPFIHCTVPMQFVSSEFPINFFLFPFLLSSFSLCLHFMHLMFLLPLCYHCVDISLEYIFPYASVDSISGKCFSYGNFSTFQIPGTTWCLKKCTRSQLECYGKEACRRVEAKKWFAKNEQGNKVNRVPKNMCKISPLMA